MPATWPAQARPGRRRPPPSGSPAPRAKLPLELVWPFTDGEDGEARYSFVIMAADGSEGVDATVTLATRFPYLRGYAIAAIVVGGVLLLVGVLLVAVPGLIGRRRRRREAPPGLEPAT